MRITGPVNAPGQASFVPNSPVAFPSSFNLVGRQVSGTTYQFNASAIIFIDSSGGVVLLDSFGAGTITRTNDIGTFGVNGRDQAGSFGASDWVYFYWIWNGAVVNTLSSLSSPQDGGPTLPAGYTHASYIAQFKLNSSNLHETELIGSRVYYRENKQILTGGGSTSEASISTAGFIPNEHRGYFESQVSGSTGSNVALRYVTGKNHFRIAATTFGQDAALYEMPVFTNQIFYICTGSISHNVFVQGYSVANQSS